MKKVYATVFTLLAGFGIAAAADGVITLDLTKAVTELEFNTDNGSWTGTFNDDEEVIESQSFIFIHSSMGDYDTWWGFSASNHADNSRPENTLTQQWSAMAKGGIELDENGDVKLDDFGAPVVSSSVPYLVAYYSSYMSARPVDMIFNDGLAHEPVGMYVCLNSYAYYSIEEGDAYARAFTNGDRFTLTVHGVAEDESEKTVDVVLGSYTNGDLTLSRGWKCRPFFARRCQRALFHHGQHRLRSIRHEHSRLLLPRQTFGKGSREYLYRYRQRICECNSLLRPRHIYAQRSRHRLCDGDRRSWPHGDFRRIIELRPLVSARRRLHRQSRQQKPQIREIIYR